MRTVLLLSALLANALCARAQTLVSIEEIGSIDRLFIVSLASSIGLTADDGIVYYRVAYTMDDLAGEQDTVTGLFVRPVNADGQGRYPTLVSQHGTTQTKFDVPSLLPVNIFTGSVPDLAYIYATQGYSVLAPDFLNMGDDEGFHPYVHARTEALAALRMLEALESAPEYTDVRGDGLYLTGYSQGGHASMALHELLIEEYPDIEIAAAAHNSGPYSVSGVMLREVALGDEPFAVPAFIPYTALAYQEVYGDLYTDLTDIFRPAYAGNIAAFRDGYETGAVTLGTLNQQLLDSLAAAGTPGLTKGIFAPGFLAEIEAGTNVEFLRALRDNDTYDFANPTPTRLHYCTADEQVSFRNSIVAEDSLNARGAADTRAVDVAPAESHGGCILPAVLASIEFFASVREASATGEIPGAAAWRWVHTADGLRVYTDDAAGAYRLQVIDAAGRVSAALPYRSGELVPLARQAAGWTAVRLVDAEGRSASRVIATNR